MFFELTDLLACPRCGPSHGLVLLVQEVNERRVESGWLGCAKCRHDFPVSGGVADLRLAPETTPRAAVAVEDDELALKVLALSGLAEERTYLLLGERLSHAAVGIVEMAPDLEVIALYPEPDGGPERHGVSRIVLDDGLPLVEFRLRAVAIAPGGDPERVRDAARRVAVGGRLVLFDAKAEDIEEVRRSALQLIAVEGGTVVAERRGGGREGAGGGSVSLPIKGPGGGSS